MFSFLLPFLTNPSVTTAQQSQQNNVMTPPALFSSGNRLYHHASVQDKPYLHQWHSGGVARVTTPTTEADFRVSDDAIRKCGRTQGNSASKLHKSYKPYKLYNKLTHSQSQRVQVRV